MSYLKSTCMVSLLLPLICSAKEPQDFDLYSLSLQELIQLQISVATRNNIKISQSPSTVSLFVREQLDHLAVNTLTELFQYIPGFYSSYNPAENNKSYVATRGHAQKYANTILFLFNGQRINEDYTGGLNYFLQHFDLSHVDRIEVIRGPGSALYGSNAFNGVINIISNTTDTSVSVLAGSQERAGASGQWSRQSDDLQVSFSGTFYQDEGDNFNEVFDRFNRQDFTQDPRDHLQLEAFAQYDKLLWRTLYHQSTQEDYHLFNRINDGTNKLEQSTLLTQVEYKWIENSRSNIKISGQWHQATRDSLAALALQDNADFVEADFLFGEKFKYQSYRMAVDGDYKINQSHVFLAGIEWQQSKLPDAYLKSNYDFLNDLAYLSRTVVFDEDSQRTVLDKTREIVSVYSQLQSSWQERWFLVLGVRYDDYNDIDGSFNPRASLVYQHDDNQTIKVIYGEAYRAPALGDLYDIESGLVDGNETLKATALKSLELVYSYTSKNWYLSVIGFNNELEDLIGFTDTIPTKLDNITKNRATGLEFEFQWHYNDSTQFSGSVTHLLHNESNQQDNASITVSEQLVPETYFNINWDQTITEHWSSHTQLVWRDSIEVLNDNSSLAIFNWNINYQLSKKSTIKLMATNIFDKNYDFIASSPIGSDNGDPVFEEPARGREVTVKFHYQF